MGTQSWKHLWIITFFNRIFFKFTIFTSFFKSTRKCSPVLLAIYIPRWAIRSKSVNTLSILKPWKFHSFENFFASILARSKFCELIILFRFFISTNFFKSVHIIWVIILRGFLTKWCHTISKLNISWIIQAISLICLEFSTWGIWVTCLFILYIYNYCQ